MYFLKRWNDSNISINQYNTLMIPERNLIAMKLCRGHTKGDLEVDSHLKTNPDETTFFNLYIFGCGLAVPELISYSKYFMLSLEKQGLLMKRVPTTVASARCLFDFFIVNQVQMFHVYTNTKATRLFLIWFDSSSGKSIPMLSPRAGMGSVLTEKNKGWSYDPPICANQ